MRFVALGVEDERMSRRISEKVVRMAWRCCVSAEVQKSVITSREAWRRDSPLMPAHDMAPSIRARRAQGWVLGSKIGRRAERR